MNQAQLPTGRLVFANLPTNTADGRLSLPACDPLHFQFIGRFWRASFAHHHLLPWKVLAGWTLSTPVQESWRDGTGAVVLTPHDLLVACVQPARYPTSTKAGTSTFRLMPSKGRVLAA